MYNPILAYGMLLAFAFLFGALFTFLAGTIPVLIDHYRKSKNRKREVPTMVRRRDFNDE